MENPTSTENEQVEVKNSVPTILVNPNPDDPATPKRGWVIDQIMLIGQAEASLNHIDERICDLWTDLDNLADTDTEPKIVTELAELYDLTKTLYKLRVDAENQVFDAFPDADRTKWCLVKHLATTYAIACENFHARECDPEAEKVMIDGGEALAKITAMALGFQPFGCFRCLSEAMEQKDESN